MMRPVQWWHSILPLCLSCLDRTGLTCHWSADCCTGYNIKKCFYITGSNLHTCKLTLTQAKFNLLVLKWIISHPHFCYHSMCSILALEHIKVGFVLFLVGRSWTELWCWSCQACRLSCSSLPLLLLLLQLLWSQWVVYIHISYKDSQQHSNMKWQSVVFKIYRW